MEITILYASQHEVDSTDSRVCRPSFVMTAIEHFQYGNISQQVFDLDVKDNRNFTAKDKVRRATITLSHEFLIYGR